MRSFRIIKFIVNLMQDIRNKIIEYRNERKTRGT
jgi:hypothetical protein